MPLIDNAEPKKPFKKKNQRPWDLLGENTPAATPESGAKAGAAAASAGPGLEGTSPMLDAVLIEIDRIRPDPNQVRQHVDVGSTEMAELAQSIKSHGVRQPV